MERLKQKVASSSSRVIASLQLAATGTFQPSTSRPIHEQQYQQAAPADQLGRRLMADADATAHLTEEEREILLEVFNKEAEFQRDTIIQMGGANHSQVEPLEAQDTDRAPARCSSHRDRSAMAQRQTSSSSSSRSFKQQRHQPQYASPSPSTTADTSHSSSTLTNTASTYLASARSSITPSSRPSSSLFAGTPTTQMNARRRESSTRAGSSCSSSGSAQQQQQQQQQQQHPQKSVGQCRICRKLILTNEPCHLCSNCNQFICDDCASYSASDQHWMCSSCRRRATKPAIPADALRELGLNQNSSPVRRMTLRLNQNDLRLELAKGFGESNASSNSSSGCSSMSAAPPTHQLATTHVSGGHVQPSIHQQQQQQHQASRSSGGERHAAVQQQQSQDRRLEARSPGQQLRRRDSNTGPPESILCNGTDLHYNAHKTRSNPIADSSENPAPQARNNRAAVAPRNSSSGSGGSATPGQPSSHISCSSVVQAKAASVDLCPRQQPRRASVAAPDGTCRGRASGRTPLAAGPTSAMVAMKQSSGNLLMMQAQAAGQLVSAADLSYSPERPGHAGASAFEAGHRRQSIRRPAHNINSASQQQFMMGQPRTMVTASSELSMSGLGPESRRESSGSILGGALIPIPADQIHLRRLSDQSNLVRRSSIIADSMDAASMQHRNRSHSNIDTVSYAFYQAQFRPQHLAGREESSRDYLGGQQHPERRDSALCGLDQAGSDLAQQPLESIITPYWQKHRRSSDDLRSDSSSDIDEDPQIGQTNLELDSEQPNEYFAPPRGFEFPAPTAADQHLQQSYLTELASRAAGTSIPSVSISEFTSSQQRLNQMQQQQQPQLMQLEQLMTSPIQINVAIEHAIKQQYQQQDLAQQYLPASDLLGARHVELHQQLPVEFMATASRRGSSGRILPKIPGDQSQSMLDLPLSVRAGPVSGASQFGSAGGPAAASGGRSSLSNGSMDRLPGTGGLQQPLLGSTLDLPSASQTIRRASAPEGQNIKIVVDDMDGAAMMRSNGYCSGSIMMAADPGGPLAMQPTGGHNRQYQYQYQYEYQFQFQNQNPNHHHHQYGKQGELCERIVLYRDDSLDPSTNMARGFGLQVMGGKIDEDGKLQACVVWILVGGPADKVGLKCGDKIVEWDSKCLVNMTYEQVADVIESSANIAELLVKPAHRLQVQPGSASVVRSQRRLSHQTESDLKKVIQQQQQQRPPASYERLASSSGQQPQLQWQQPMGQQPTNRTSHLLEAGSGPQPHRQQAISAGNSPLRGGTGRKLPQIPGSGPSSDMDQMKLNSSSTSHLEQQTGGYHGPQLQAERQTLSSRSKPRQVSRYPLGQAPGELAPLESGNQANLKTLGPNGCATTNMPQPNQVEVCGLIGLQVNVDERASQLEISVLSAINLNVNSSFDYYARLRILPESTRFKACKTLPRSDLNWKETFLFQNFPTDQLNRMALEIGVWLHDEAPRLSTQLAHPICEAMIPIQSARERNTDFWPMRRPPSSPQARRKSLNDLLEIHHKQLDDRSVGTRLSTGHQDSNNLLADFPVYTARVEPQKQQALCCLQLAQFQANQTGCQFENGVFVRARSSSNRNLPDTGKLRVQPRRASDEVASSSSQRLSSRLSPAASRRSISVINVNPDVSAASQMRPSLLGQGSQSSLFKGRQPKRDSTVAHQPSSSGDSVVSRIGSSSQRRATREHELDPKEQSAGPATGEGLTPSGRRSSLVGINTMVGYTSQKSSLSDASDQKAPTKLTPAATRRFSQAPTGTPHLADGDSKASASSNFSQPTRDPTPANKPSTGSRRGSTEQGAPRLERKGSFAMLTLRKLKRTMSLTKGNEQETHGSTQASRRSSSEYDTDVCEDLGVTRRLIGHTPPEDCVGRLKMSFIMTKGQLEIDVISAQGLKYDLESSLGVYVKMYLKGRNKSNKRKTRLVHPWISPIFKQLIKYDGCLVDNKSLEISLWQKQGGLKGKIPIGFSEIRLSELSLDCLQTSWYNLHPIDMMCSSSVEDQ